MDTFDEIKNYVALSTQSKSHYQKTRSSLTRSPCECMKRLEVWTKQYALNANPTNYKHYKGRVSHALSATERRPRATSQSKCKRMQKDTTPPPHKDSKKINNNINMRTPNIRISHILFGNKEYEKEIYIRKYILLSGKANDRL